MRKDACQWRTHVKDISGPAVFLKLHSERDVVVFVQFGIRIFIGMKERIC
jgi:hypothetical protein